MQRMVFLSSILIVSSARAQRPPVVDAHQHLLSPAIAQLLGASPASANDGPIARDLIAMLDSAHIHRAVVLSLAYMYGSPSRTVADEYAKVRAENDWTAVQATLYPDRLVALCSFNPLKSYALEELARCAGDSRLRRGIKLQFANSGVRLDAAEDIKQLQAIFRAANARGMAIVVHLRVSADGQYAYGTAEAHTFLEQLLPFAPDVPVQVAHFAVAGPGYHDQGGDSVMAVLADAVAHHDPAAAHLWFDVAGLADDHISAEEAARLVQRIRRVGVERVLYGSDAAFGNNLRPREGWRAFGRLPLTSLEFTKIARNLPPYIR